MSAKASPPLTIIIAGVTFACKVAWPVHTPFELLYTIHELLALELGQFAADLILIAAHFARKGSQQTRAACAIAWLAYSWLQTGT